MAKAKKAIDTEKIILEVKPRTVLGKKLRKLRKEGIIPANIYGTDFPSQSISVNMRDFTKVYKTARETGVVYLKLDDKEIPTMIKNLQRHPVNDYILHADFRKIDLKKKIETEVPVKIVGTSEAVVQKSGVLLTLSEALLVEALPQEIPQAIEVDISSLKEIGQEIKVADLKKSEKYEIKEEPNKVIVSVVEHKEESITPETTTPTAPEVITEAVKTEEGVVPGEEETKTKPEAEQKTEKKSEPKTEEKK